MYFSNILKNGWYKISMVPEEKKTILLLIVKTLMNDKASILSNT